MSNSVWYISFSENKIEFKQYPKSKKKKKNVKKAGKNSAKKSFVNLFFVLSFVVFFAAFSTAQINDTFHINIQTTDSAGEIVTGTFDFTFNITESSNQTACEGPTVYNHTFSGTATDVRGIVSLYLPTVGSGGGSLSELDFDKQYYLCYTRDGELKDVSQLGRVPYAFAARLSDLDIDSDLNMSERNITDVDTGLFDFLGSVANRVTGLFVQDVNASGDVNISGDASVSGDLEVVGPWRTVLTGGSEMLSATGPFGDVKFFRPPMTSDIALYAGGLERVRITNETRVGIGTTEPSETLDVEGNATANWFIGAFNWIIGADSEPYLDFNGTQLDFHEDQLNTTIDSRVTEAEGTLHVNMSDWWNTGDRGALRNISEIHGSWFVNDLAWINFTEGDDRYILIEDEADLNVNRSEWWRTAEGDLNNVEDILGSWLTNDLQWINFTEGDDRYILLTDESNLNVNSSDFWITDEGIKENVVDILGSEITNDLGWINFTQADPRYVEVEGDTMTGNLAIDANLTVGTNVLFADSNNNLVGIGTLTPENTLNVIGDINATTNIYGNVIFQDGNQVLDTETLFSGDVSGTYDAIQLGEGVVGTINLANGSVTGVKIAASSVNTTHIVDGTILDEDISPDADIQWSKLSDYPYVIAGDGLGGGGQIDENVTLNIGQGVGIIVSDDEISLNQTFTDEKYVEVEGDTMTGDLIVDANLTVGTNVLFADSNNNLVGIGTTTPENKLNVIGDINATETIYAGEFSGPINWTFLQKYPNACPEGEVVQAIGDTLDCVPVDPANVVNGTGTVDYIPRWIANHSLGDSIIKQDGTEVTVEGDLNVNDLVASGDINVTGRLDVGQDLGVAGSADVEGNLTIGTNTLFVDSDGTVVGIGTVDPQNALNVIGDGNFTETVYADEFVESGEGLSDKYVLKAGDTMTGALTIDGSDSDGIALNVTGDLIVNDTSGRVGLPGETALRILSLDSNNDIVSTSLANWISGTSDQISVVDDGSGGVEVSLPQDINETSSPTFLELTLSGLTQGSVIFAGADGLLSQDNANFFWNETNGRLGIGTDDPQQELNVEGDANVTGTAYVGNAEIFTDGNGDVVFKING